MRISTFALIDFALIVPYLLHELAVAADQLMETPSTPGILEMSPLSAIAAASRNQPTNVAAELAPSESLFLDSSRSIEIFWTGDRHFLVSYLGPNFQVRSRFARALETFEWSSRTKRKIGILEFARHGVRTASRIRLARSIAKSLF